jgi:hypothetical protein
MVDKTETGGTPRRAASFDWTWTCSFHRGIPNLLFFLEKLGSPSRSDPALDCVTDDFMVSVQAQLPHKVG